MLGLEFWCILRKLPADARIRDGHDVGDGIFVRSGSEPAERTELLAALDACASRLRRVALSGSATCATPPGAVIQVDVDLRLVMPLTGEDRRSVNSGGRAETLLLRPGEAFVFAPQAWTAVHHDRPCRFLSLVFRSGFVRLLIVERRLRRPELLVEHHTARPAQGALLHAARSLSALAETGDEDGAAVALTAALLRMTRAHLARDAVQPAGRAGGAMATWSRIVEHLHQRYADEVSRAAVARAFGLNPSYVSALARDCGEGFAATLAGIRCARASHLLLRTDLPLREIARQCGYREVGYFIRAFKRREGTTPGALRRTGSRGKALPEA
jgi:AraC-like DNA-binding protein